MERPCWAIHCEGCMVLPHWRWQAHHLKLSRNFRWQPGYIKPLHLGALWAQSTDPCQVIPVSPWLFLFSTRLFIHSTFYQATSQTPLLSPPVKITVQSPSSLEVRIAASSEWRVKRTDWEGAKGEFWRLETFHADPVRGEHVHENSLTYNQCAF